MCSTEGDYIDAIKTDGSKIKIFWWDLADSVPWRDQSRYNDAFPWTTVFRAEDWEEWSQVEKRAAKPHEAVSARQENDFAILLNRGVRVETIDIVGRGVPVAFEDRFAHART